MSNKLSCNLLKKINQLDPVDFMINQASGGSIIDSFTDACESVANPCNIKQNNIDYLDEEDRYEDKIIAHLWNFKCIEGQFNETSKLCLISHIKQGLNMCRRGVSWTVCYRLNMMKRSILKHYLKQFIHDIIREQICEEEEGGGFKRRMSHIREREHEVIERIVNKCIYLPPNKNRHLIVIQPFEDVENIIKEEVGSYLFLQEKISEDIWKCFVARLKNSLIALFTTLGILEITLTGLMF